MKHYVPVANSDLSFRSIGRDANIFACHYWHHKSISSASIVRETTVFQPQLFLLREPLYSLWYKMCACRRIHHQRQKRTGLGAIVTKRTGDNHFGQDREERQIDSYGYNSDYVRMFDSIGIMELDASQDRVLAGLGKATREKYLGRSREFNEMEVRCIRTRSRVSVSTTTNTATMIMTCAADRSKYLLRYMKEYVPDLILMTEVLNLLLR